MFTYLLPRNQKQEKRETEYKHQSSWKHSQEIPDNVGRCTKPFSGAGHHIKN